MELESTRRPSGTLSWFNNFDDSKSSALNSNSNYLIKSWTKMRDVINSATEWWCGLILKAKTWCNLSAAQVKYGDRLERINGIRVQSSPAEAGQPIRGEASMHEIVAGHWNMLFSPPNRQSFFFWLIDQYPFFCFFSQVAGKFAVNCRRRS